MDNRPSLVEPNSLSALFPTAGNRADMGRVTRWLVRGCATLSTALGAIVLAGWFLHIEIIKSVLSGHVTMKANTALGFLFAGIGFSFAISHLPRAQTLSRLAASFVFLLAVASLAEYIFHVDLRIDQLLIRDSQQLVSPGRPSFVTSTAFCLSAISIFLLTGSSLSRRISQFIALLLATLALASITGYLYGVPVLYGSFATANSMAFHTGAGFLILGCGLVLARFDSTIGRLLAAKERGSWLAWRLIPGLVVTPVLLGYLYVRPAINLGQLRFGMALFAVTLVVAGFLSLVVIGTSLNHSERRQREGMQVAMEASAAIEISEQELRLITDNLPSLIAYIDMSEKFVRVNRTYHSWLNIQPEKLIGRTELEVLGRDYWEHTQNARTAAHSGHPTSIETPYPTVKGNRRAIVTYAPDLDLIGVVRGLVVMVVDVEDQRRAEAALRQSEKLAAVGRLSSSIAHEINNPVDAAMNLLFLVREQVADDEARAMLDLADAELKRVATIANETLRFQKQSNQLEPILAADLFRSVLVLHGRRIRNNRIQVERRDRAVERFQCFEGELRQVLNNLVANALDAMLPGGRLLLRSRPAVDWSTGQRGIALTVADDGAGMDKETSERVFEAFFTTKGFGGTGLGLWISAEIVTRMGGRVRIRTSTAEQRHGSVFTIFLPSGIQTLDSPAPHAEPALTEP